MDFTKIFNINLLAVVFYLAAISPLQGQNPFEIQSRLPDSLQTSIQPHAESIPGADTSLFANPFDVSHEILQTDQDVKEKPPPLITEINAGGRKVQGFIFWLLLFNLLLLVVIINSNRNLFFKLFRAIANENMLRLIQREENNGFSGYFIFLFGFFILNAGLFLFLSLDHFQAYSGYQYFLISLAVVSFVYLFRHLFMYILKTVFPFGRSVGTYNFSILLFNGVMSVFLLPLNAFLAYGPEDMIFPFFVIGFIVILAFYLVRQLRGLFIALGTPDFSFFHFFIYFCTCEIAPILVFLIVFDSVKP